MRGEKFGQTDVNTSYFFSLFSYKNRRKIVVKLGLDDAKTRRNLPFHSSFLLAHPLTLSLLARAAHTSHSPATAQLACSFPLITRNLIHTPPARVAPTLAVLRRAKRVDHNKTRIPGRRDSIENGHPRKPISLTERASASGVTRYPGTNGDVKRAKRAVPARWGSGASRQIPS